MFKNFSIIILFSIGLLFCAVSFLYLSLSVAISELDDARLIQIFGIPSFILSNFICFWLIILRSKILCIVLLIINSTSALISFIATFPGTWNIINLNNTYFSGDKGNNYSSLDLFSIGIIPVIIIALVWLIYWVSRKTTLETTT